MYNIPMQAQLERLNTKVYHSETRIFSRIQSPTSELSFSTSWLTWLKDSHNSTDKLTLLRSKSPRKLRRVRRLFVVTTVDKPWEREGRSNRVKYNSLKKLFFLELRASLIHYKVPNWQQYAKRHFLQKTRNSTFRATIRSGSWSNLSERTFWSFLESGFEDESSFLGDILRVKVQLVCIIIN